MMMTMRIGSTMGRRLASAVLPLAVVAALPLVQWCPLRAAVTLRDCLPGSEWPASAAPAPPACAGVPTACGAHDAACGHCPFQRSTPPTRCIGAPMGGPGLRPHTPEIHPPALEVALVDAATPIVEAPREAGPAASQADARPPTRSRARRPPVRGPPLA